MEATEKKDRYVVRDATGEAWSWLPDWLIVDTEKEVRVGAYGREEDARQHCAQLNEKGYVDAS